jgi:ribonuclease HI
MSRAGKCYAVRVGRRPGIYSTWDECNAQVSGFSGAVFKSFKSQEEALAFISGQPPQLARAAPAPAPGSTPAIYVDGGQNKATNDARPGATCAWGRVVDAAGNDLLAPFAHLLGDMQLRDVVLPGGRAMHVILADFAGVSQQNNGAELLAMVAGLRIALDGAAIREIRSDSELLVCYWSRGQHNATGDPRKVVFIRECAELRRRFEARGGAVVKISGDKNLADLGCHRT